MMFMTYPDGTKELHDGGLMIRVHDGEVTAATLTLPRGAEPEPIHVALGSRQHIGYLWQKKTGQKWVAQLEGQEPFLTDSGEVWAPQATPTPAGHEVAS